MRIEVRELDKSFGAHAVLRGIALEVRSGELLALLGPSGCGKTTLLRILAGLEYPDGGSVHFDGEEVTDRPVRARRLGFVFQHFALFRHLSVFENVAFGLRVKPRGQRPPEKEIRARVAELLRLVRLEPQAQHVPSELSGGQRQRVALARALAVEPRVLLLDEPFGSLDAQVRRELRGWLRRLHDELHLTSVLVTHDQEEALSVADRVAVMDAGEIIQTGTPEEVYLRPATPFVYHFLGSVNVLHGERSGGAVRLGSAVLLAGGEPGAAAGEVVIYIRPHHLEVRPPSSEPEEGHWSAVVRHVHLAGPTVRVELECASGETAVAEISHERFDALRASCGHGLARGSAVRLRVRPEHVYVGEGPR
jgi:sulfate transport system ATP-binding protein